MRLGLLESVTQLNSHALPDIRAFFYALHNQITSHINALFTAINTTCRAGFFDLDFAQQR